MTPLLRVVSLVRPARIGSTVSRITAATFKIDQERQRQVEQPYDPVARRVVVEQMTEATTP
jgi:hypothetical protein